MSSVAQSRQSMGSNTRPCREGISSSVGLGGKRRRHNDNGIYTVTLSVVESRVWGPGRRNTRLRWFLWWDSHLVGSWACVHTVRPPSCGAVTCVHAIVNFVVVVCWGRGEILEQTTRPRASIEASPRAADAVCLCAAWA